MRRRIYLLVMVIPWLISASTSTVDHNKINGIWYNLERDSSGYVFYTPCEGRTQYINLKKHTISIAAGLDDPENFQIDGTVKNMNEQYKIFGKNRYSKILISFRWVNQAHTIALWKFKIHYFEELYRPDDEFKWVMCPAKLKSRFKVVICPTNDTVKSAENVFLPININ